MTNPAYVDFRAQRCSRRGLFFTLTILACGVVLLILSGAIKTQSSQAEGTTISGRVTRPPTTRTTLRIGTFNIQSGHGLDGIQDLDRTASCFNDCDLIGLNEVSSSLMAQTLGEKAGLAWLFSPSEHRWWHDHWGNAMLTALPVKQWIRFPMHKTKPSGFRSVLISQQQFNGRLVNILITHTDGSEDRESQLRVVTTLFQSFQEPAILMGDLNTQPHDPQLKALANSPGVTDVLAGVVGGKYAAHHIDWIFVKGFKVVDVGVIDKGASDHPFYWADLELK